MLFCWHGNCFIISTRVLVIKNISFTLNLHTTMKTKLTSMLAFVVSALFISSCSTYAQSYGYDDYDYGRSNARYSNRNVTVEAENSDISYNLDLRAVADVFADSRNLEEFERRINDYEAGINNLDLNRDGQVDYLRVVETSKRNSHLIVLQAVVGYDMFQDVASIVVERRKNRRHYVQVIGDPYIYGPYYIIEPVYVYVPTIFSWFWGPRYYRWYSPYYWGYYPSYWHHWRPYHTNVYVNNINIYVDKSRHTYRYSDKITNNHYYEMRQGVSRSDYQRSHPDRSFSSRNIDRANVSNRRDLDNTRLSSRSGRASVGNSRRSDVNARSSRSADVNARTGRSADVNARSGRSADINARTNTQTRGAGGVSRGTGAVRSTDQWNTTRSRSTYENSRSSGSQTRTQGTVRSGDNTRSNPAASGSVNTPSRGSYEQPARSGNSTRSTVTPKRSERGSATYGTPNRSSSSSRGSESVAPRSNSSSSRGSSTYSTPSRSTNRSSSVSAPRSSSSSSRSSGSYSAPSRSSSSSRGSGTISSPSRSSSSAGASNSGRSGSRR